MIGDLACSNRSGLGPRPLTPWRGGRGSRWTSWGDVCRGLGPRRAGLPRHGRWANQPRRGRPTRRKSPSGRCWWGSGPCAHSLPTTQPQFEPWPAGHHRGASSAPMTGGMGLPCGPRGLLGSAFCALFGRKLAAPIDPSAVHRDRDRRVARPLPRAPARRRRRHLPLRRCR
jgi:hypothetical protein